MRDLVNEFIKDCTAKNLKAEVIKRYLTMKYHINMDIEAVNARINAAKLHFTP